jgi:hypothetical protein
MEPTSPKGDLRERGRYALHNGVPDTDGTGGEFSVSGIGHLVDDVAIKVIAERTASYNPAERYVLFELLINEARCNGYGDVEIPERRSGARTDRSLWLWWNFIKLEQCQDRQMSADGNIRPLSRREVLMASDNRCPGCGSDRVVPIAYGLPSAAGSTTFGEVIFGGCVIRDGAPDEGCLACGFKWVRGSEGEPILGTATTP